MKRLLKLCLLCSFILVIFVACPNSPTSEKPYSYDAKTEIGKLYRMLINQQIEACKKLVEKCLEYDYDNTLREKWTIPMELDEIYETVGFDTVKQSSSLEFTITLGDEIEEIANSYLAALNTVKPDISFLSGHDSIENYTIEIADDIVLVDGDIIIDTFSIVGIVSVEMIRSYLDGQNMDVIVTDMDNVARAYNQKRNENSLYYSPFYFEDILYGWDSDTLIIKIDGRELISKYIRFAGL
ncbi:MAG: hypothetical protein LBK66_08890 [Spirochaetaceae bacterium]|jgi:uncharacterized LabA/DUF88 family protein|nr:hypothetical protein [Spirochaetaceae bacterium]